jgi:AcrR family transcriptional regulator
VPKISAASLSEHRAETLDRLLEAFGELVMAQGYDAVSLADVAAEAGMARTAIYNYFREREELLFAWTDREVARTMDALHEEVDQAPSAAEKLRVFVHSQLASFTDRHLPPGREVAHILGPEAHRRFQAHVEPLEKLGEQIIAHGVEAGEFTVEDPAATVAMVLGCIGAERGPLSNGEHHLDGATDSVTAFLLRALGASRGATGQKSKKKTSG